MTVVNPDKKAGKGVLAVVVLLFIVGALVFTQPGNFQEHYVADDLGMLWYAIQSLMVGDVYGFFDGFVGGISVLALFMVLFAIMHFLFTTVFKKMFSKNVSTILALVIALYGFFDHRIYNYMLSLNAFTVGLLVFFALIIMIWGFSKHSGKILKDEYKLANEEMKKGKPDRDKVKELKKLLKEMD